MIYGFVAESITNGTLCIVDKCLEIYNGFQEK